MSGRIVVPLIVPDTAIEAEVDLCLVDGAYFLQARLMSACQVWSAKSPQALADAAHQTCPYSKAIRGNIDVVMNVVEARPVADVA